MGRPLTARLVLGAGRLRHDHSSPKKTQLPSAGWYHVHGRLLRVQYRHCTGTQMSCCPNPTAALQPKRSAQYHRHSGLEQVCLALLAVPGLLAQDIHARWEHQSAACSELGLSSVLTVPTPGCALFCIAQEYQLFTKAFFCLLVLSVSTSRGLGSATWFMLPVYTLEGALASSPSSREPRKMTLLSTLAVGTCPTQRHPSPPGWLKPKTLQHL